MINLSNKNVLITGASGGIGRACSELLHKLGATVIISGTRMEKLLDLQSILQERCIVRQCNILDSDDCSNMVSEIDKIDALICCAGITRDQLAIRMDLDSFRSVVDTNLVATFNLNKLVLKKMIKERYGRIINISSVVALSGNPGQANYCASKAAIIGMSKSLALEVANRNITVNVVAPGFIVSDMTNKLSEIQRESILSRIPSKRFGMPVDVANAVAFLASDQSSYISGQTLHVNGGMLMV